jgi:multimeric flavodoxin WrbA
MKILGINGSPVKGGNVDILIQEVIRRVEGQGSRVKREEGKRQEAKVEKIVSGIVYLDDLKIIPCKSCGILPQKGFCIYHDDMEKIYPRLFSYDLFVLGSPVYFDTVSAQMKLFIDRCNCLRPMRRKKDGSFYFDSGLLSEFDHPRKGIIILVGGKRQRFDCASIVLKGFLKWAGIKFFDQILYAHDDFGKGEVEKDKKFLNEVLHLSKRLAEKSTSKIPDSLGFL